MSRIANYPVDIPAGTEVKIDGLTIRIKGRAGELVHSCHPRVNVVQEDGALKVRGADDSKPTQALAGTTRAVLHNMVRGVSEGFEQKLEIVGVGYRAQVQGKSLNLTLGFSHPVALSIPDGLSVETPSQTEIVVKGADKHKVGQLAANIRAYRPPEPYKGKGVRYSGERIVRKEAKKA